MDAPRQTWVESLLPAFPTRRATRTIWSASIWASLAAYSGVYSTHSSLKRLMNWSNSIGSSGCKFFR